VLGLDGNQPKYLLERVKIRISSRKRLSAVQQSGESGGEAGGAGAQRAHVGALALPAAKGQSGAPEGRLHIVCKRFRRPPKPSPRAFTRPYAFITLHFPLLTRIRILKQTISAMVEACFTE